MLDKYYELKIKYLDYILFLKRGKFYYCYKDDAYIIHYLFKYKLVNDCVSFSEEALDKVLNVLDDRDLGCVIFDGIVLDKVYGDSVKYSYVYNDSLEYISKENIINNINDKLKNYTLEQLLQLVSTI